MIGARTGAIQLILDPIRGDIAQPFRQLLAILALTGAEQPVDVPHGTCSGFRTGKQRFKSLGEVIDVIDDDGVCIAHSPKSVRGK